MSLLLFYSLFLAVAAVSAFVWLLVILFGQNKQPHDDTLFNNFLPQYAHGHGSGKILDVIHGHRTGILFLPDDVDRVKAFKLKKKLIIEPELVWFENDKIKDWPKGSLSAYRNVKWGLAPKAEDYNELIKTNEIGQALMKVTEDNNIKTEEVEVLRNRINVQNALVNKTEGLGLVQDFMDKTSEINKDIIKQTGSEKSKSTIITPHNSNNS